MDKFGSDRVERDIPSQKTVRYSLERDSVVGLWLRLVQIITYFFQF